MTFQAVLFDFGGVLVRTFDQAGRWRWDERLGLPHGSVERAVFNSMLARHATAGAAPVSAIWEDAARALGLDAEQLLQFRRDFWAGDRLDAALVEFLRSLRPTYKTGILSNAWSNGRRVIAEDYGLADAVDEIIVSAEEGLAKPDARLFARAVQRLGVPAAAAIMVDDFVENVNGAVAAGLTGVLFRNTSQVIADLSLLLNISH
jgi:putative hydrolase of the HAD superfamily